MNKPTCNTSAIAAVVALGIGAASAAPISFTSTGADAASILATVNDFRAALGVNNGVGPCSGACTPGVGRREINWDAVPDSFASGGANPFPGNFFNLATGSPAGRVRGAQFSTTGAFEVSADADSDNDGNPGPVAPLFGNHTPDNADDFAAFSPERIFGLVGTNEMDVAFAVPGVPGSLARVRGFGVVFTDVEVAGSTRLDFYGLHGLLASLDAPAFPFVGGDSGKSFSFAGLVFDSAEVARVHIVNGGYDLDVATLFGIADGVAMDDFIYGEPLLVPEPGSLALAAGGLALFGMTRRRRG